MDGSKASAPIPWLSALLALACVAVTFATRPADHEARARADQDLAAAESYFLDHPYLDARAGLEQRLSKPFVEQKRAEYEKARRHRGGLSTPPRVAVRQQAELDGLLETASAALADLPTRRLGLDAGERAPATFFSHVLIHTGQWHLIGNVLLLLLLGVYLEPAWGRMGWAAVAVCAALGSAGVFVLANPEASRPLVGASGMLAGLLAAFALQFLRRSSEGFFVVGAVCGTLWLLLPVWLGAEWSLADSGAPFAEPAGGRIVFWSLAGGVLGALPALALVRLLGLDQRAARSSGGDPELERALHERSRGNDAVAFERLCELLRARPDHLEASLALWDVGNVIGRRVEASAAMVRAVREELRRGLDAEAVDHWLELTADGFPQEAEPALLIRMALVLREADQRHAAVEALRIALERSEGASRAVVATRVARAAADLDAETAQDAAWRALGSLELELEERQALEALLGEIIPRPEPSARRAPLPLAEPPAEPAPVDPDGRPSPIEIDMRERTLDVLTAVPVELDEVGIRVTIGDAAKRVRYARIQAVGVAAVHGLGEKPVLLIDLVLNWMTTADEKLRVIRLRGDRFDPRALVPGQSSPVAALRVLVETLLQRSDAAPLPDADSAAGHPFAYFDELAVYHRTVLLVDDLGEAAKPD